MSRSTRVFLAVMLAGTVIVVASVGAAAAAVYRAGSIAVDVEQDQQSDVRVRVPAALAHLAIACVPASLLREATTELEPVLPAARAAWTQLEGTPDFVLVEIVSGDERVRVEKRDRSLRVSVDSDGARFDVGVPLSTVGALLARLDRARA